MADASLQKFCAKLTKDKNMWAEFRTDPSGVIRAAGLTSDAEKAFTQGTYQEMLSLLDRSASTFSCFVVNPTKK